MAKANASTCKPILLLLVAFLGIICTECGEKTNSEQVKSKPSLPQGITMTVTANKEPIVHFRDASAGGIITLKGDLDLLPIDFKKNINVDIYYGTDEFELKNKATAVLEDTEESFGALTISFTARLNGLDDGEVYYFGIKANYGKESPVEVASVKFFTLPDGAVDLDLPSGNLWLSNNLGATYPEESGDYYAWAETEPKKTNGLYNWSSYKWCDGSYDKLTKYCLSQWVGIVDNKNTIEREDDAATKKMGGSWHIASELEWSELLTKCQRESIKYNGVPGVLFRSKNNPNDNKKVIFIPASGYYSGGQISDEYRCCYWSSTCCESYSSYDAYYFTSEYSFYSKMSYSSRCLGLSIRPCRAKI